MVKLAETRFDLSGSWVGEQSKKVAALPIFDSSGLVVELNGLTVSEWALVECLPEIG